MSDGSSPSLSSFHPGDTSTIIEDFPSKLTRPFLHPTISRLRSFVPQTSNKHIVSVSNHRDTISSPSHLSISRTSSTNNLHSHSEEDINRRTPPREVFRWAVLQDIGQQIYSRKAASVLGSFHGSPTVFSANGLICIGTDRGRVLVFDFKQQLKCICGADDTAEVGGPVTALALSRDHTFIAVGHYHGHIKLFDLSRPQTPARFVTPTSLAAVASGRKEGHIEGSRILSVDFVGARHTAIVSADEVGLAFYHSLGKVMFVEATDTLRVLGKYPESIRDVQGKHDNATKLGKGNLTDHRLRDSRPKRGNTILAMTCLPLGSCAHSTESYNLIALLTPAKLVIVALKPSPRTWFRKHRHDINETVPGSSRFRGCLAWFPSIDIHSTTNDGPSAISQQPKGLGTHPVLAYSWGREIYLLRISETRVQQKVKSSKTPEKFTIVDVGKLEFEEVLRWSTDVDYWAIQWLNVHLLLACTATHFEVWDVRTGTRVEHVPFDVASIFQPESEDHIDYGRLAHCLRVYKGRIFLLGRHELKAGTLLSWADRILSFVESGDFLNAIDSCRLYYLGTAPGNRIGLPDDPVILQTLVGQRMRDLMSASARYAFAEERFTDNTHVTPDGRGIDRTSLFEGLVNVSIDACIVLGDLEFIFEDLFEYYQNAGITPIFLKRLEKYVLDGSIRAIPPRITQRLVAIHADQGDFGEAEQLIWHIDPDCLDVHQAITLCRENHLYDALIYVYTRSLRDFVTPLVDLLNLIRQIQRHRREPKLLGISTKDNLASQMPSTHFSETMVLDAYKVYTYLADTLSGLVYPSQRFMPSEDALLAKRSIYAFLFFGTSHVWPEGNDGKFILTSEEEGGVEPTYPYVRLLLRFDAEAFLHTMDMAFEDDYFNDDSQSVNRLVIIRIFLEILPSSSNLSSSARTMLNIFIARNVPKYPQSIYTYMLPSALHDILVGLATDVDASTREDRQLAAEYLLSVYSPHNNEKAIKLFQEAGFYRILRNWYRQDHKWNYLISTFVEDPDVDAAEIFESLEEVLSTVARASKGVFPEEVLAATMRAIPLLLETGVTETAFLVDKHVSILHRQVLEEITSPYKQFVYLRCLIEPGSVSEEVSWSNPPGIRKLRPSRKLDESSKMLYLQLLCQYDASGVIGCLDNVDDDFFEWTKVVSICEQAGVHEAIVWYLDKHGDTQAAFEKLKAVNTTLALQLGESLLFEHTTLENAMETQNLLSKLNALGDIGLRICSKSSVLDSLASSVVEDSWFSLLGSQIDTAQTVSGFCKYEGRETGVMTLDQEEILNSLRSSVQTTFTSLMALGSSSALSFPRLFKRLVESASSSSSSSRSSYSEFRIILTGMLDSYRGEGDLLLITSRLVERDLFMAVENLARTRSRGSKAQDVVCAHCKKHLQENSSIATERWEGSDWTKSGEGGWVVQRITGLPFHRKCFPLKSNDIG
ncbi:Golgi CORVET complex core vacuolar protein 8-domain-containing protein [Hysterangium stoloniferum]|nr:Golgi CORVET complex core vacuolar protein 8-domain-containing protein [Hysterangium stoloniferum]